MTNRELFKSALIDAINSNFEQELADYANESAVCSKKHYKKLEKITGLKLTSPSLPYVSKRAATAILIAAALLLSACAAIIHREEIGDFVENIYDKYVTLTPLSYTEEDIDELQEIYEFKHIPDGFELKDSSVNRLYTKYIYENALGEQITLKQIINKCSVYLDNEYSSSKLLKTDAADIYCRDYNKGFEYIWIKDNYLFSLYITFDIDSEELENIIDNISIKTDK